MNYSIEEVRYYQYWNDQWVEFNHEDVTSFSEGEYGLYHSCDDSPSVEITTSHYKSMWWHRHGISHRLIGPCMILNNGDDKTWGILGKQYYPYDLIERFLLYIDH